MWKKFCRSWIALAWVSLIVVSGLNVVTGQDPIKNTDDSSSGSSLVSVLAGPVSAPATVQSMQQDNSLLLAEDVRKALRLGVEYLKGEQQKDGSWRQVRSRGDLTALCALALLNAEEAPDSPAIQKAINSILAVPDDQLATYFVALRIMTLAAADPAGEKYRRSIAKDVRWLLTMQVTADKGRNAGGWSYGQSIGAGADASNSQFALLALHEASRMGIKIPSAHWELAKQYWINCFDERSGGFYYTVEGSDIRGSMTCAGISSWIIIQENLADVANEFDGDRAICCGDTEEMETVEKAIQWLAKNFTVKASPRSQGRGHHETQLYYLYGMERAGRLSGRRFFGPFDWYRLGAKEIIGRQSLTGYWITKGGHGEDNPRVATALALLFLAKGKRPVAIGKYKYGDNDAWDQHPKGVHYLTRRLEDEWKQKLNWQTVAGENASVDDLLEAPVLFVSGREQLTMTAEQKANLKKYLENGGFLFAEACQGEGCGDAEFDQAFRKLMAEIFPDSELQPLDPGHPIWNAHYPVLPNSERPMLGLQACCRTSVVYCPTNLSCYWALDRPAINSVANQQLQSRIEYCAKLGVNVVTYATGRQLKEKGETPKLHEQSAEMLADRVLVFPKLLHDGGADDAPNAWRNVLLDVETVGLRIKLDKKMIAPELEQLADYPFVFMHGRGDFRFTEEQRESLRTYLDVGGFIFADSICSSPQFTAAFRNEMKTILGDRLQPIPPDHEIWSEASGYRIDEVTLRKKDTSAPGGFSELTQRPQLEGWENAGRLVVVFSPHDLSCALENTAVSQCTGYTRADAVRIGTNVVLYSLLSDGGR